MIRVTVNIEQRILLPIIDLYRLYSPLADLVVWILHVLKLKVENVLVEVAGSYVSDHKRRCSDTQPHEA